MAILAVLLCAIFIALLFIHSTLLDIADKLSEILNAIEDD